MSDLLAFNFYLQHSSQNIMTKFDFIAFLTSTNPFTSAQKQIPSDNYHSLLLLPLYCLFEMSHFRIQRKLTEGSSIKLKPSLSNPYRIKSLQSREHSFSRSPKKIDHHELRRLVKKISVRQPSEQSLLMKNRMEEGIKAYKQKNVCKALNLFKEIRKNGEKSCELSFYMGSCFLNTGKHQSSIMHLNDCLLLDPKYSQNAYLYIAVNFKMLGNHRQAVRILEQGLQLFPNFQEGHFYRAKLLMKLGDISEAVQSFHRCLLINASNELATIFLGDCLKIQGKETQALEKYRRIAKRGKKHFELAAIKMSNILIQKKQYIEVLDDLMSLVSKGVESPEINYLLGMSCWGLGRKHEGAVYLQSCLTGSKEMEQAGKALKALMKLSIEQTNFFEAEHLIKRIGQLGLQQSYFSEWKLFIEGVNDLIKRKSGPALLKFQKASEVLRERQIIEKHHNKKEYQQFRQNIYPYMAYALYLNDKLSQSIKIYDKALQLNADCPALNYSKRIAEGLLFHQHKQFSDASRSFQKAFAVQNRPQAMFMACISLVQRFKQRNQDKKQTLQIIQNYILRANLQDNRYPLMLFYKSLVMLFQGKSCIETIQTAINLCDEPVSEYHFIEALALQQTGKISNSLRAISKAIQIDPGIQQFYRERSKYYFLAEEYSLAIEDCIKAQSMAPEDEELQLLLSFYYYLLGDYVLAFDCLQNARPQSGKLLQFEQALFLRLGQYEKLSFVGQLILSIGEGKQPNEQIMSTIQKYISERYQFSQFSVYFYHLLLASAYCKLNEYDRALNHLFGCLEQIQTLVDERETKNSSYEVTWQQTQSMLDQVKFNIVVVSLLKQNQQQAQHFIKVFINQTQSTQLKQTLLVLLKIIKQEETGSINKLLIDDDQPRISDTFPSFSVKVRTNQIVTKILISYPVKLKFTIAPEFDPAYLLNFDIDKIDYKIPPPWLKTPTKKVNFTNSIRNQSVLLTESQVSEKRSSRSRSIVIRPLLRDQLKLDEQLQAKLNRLIKK